MLSFNPLIQKDSFEQRPSFGRGFGHHHAPGLHRQHSVPQHRAAESSSTARIEESLNIAYQKMHAVVSGRLQTNSVDDATQPPPAVDDFSPQAVADRVVGFIADRLQQEKANGASEEKLQDLYQQALNGVEQGLREGKDIIQNQGIFDGEVKDNFYSTVNLVADGLEQLGEDLFGSQQPAPVESSSFNASASEVFMSRSRSFEMEVITQDGDKVTLTVNSGQQFSSKSVEFASSNVEGSRFESEFSSYDNLAFKVEGDLDEGEMAALTDLFSQVNDVAGVFYGGDVEQAFDQAMGVGMNSEELAAYAVNMNQSETIAVKQAYVSVESMAGPVQHNPMEDMMSRLGSFVDKIAQAREHLAQVQSQAFDINSLFGDVVGNLHSNGAEEPSSENPFKQFVHDLA